MNRARNRKIAYLLAIVLLFTTMIGVSRHLEGLQENLGIAQKSLGKVNPVSGTAQLVLGGLRGVAVTILWYQAQDLQAKERYYQIEPVVESITLLQPHFQSPWEFQAWNLAYNIPADFESVKDKYYWIRRGIEFMKNATETNRRKADLEWYVGHMYFTRFGGSDEKTFLRQLFREEPDADFALASSGIKDNFEVSHDWFRKANDTCFAENRRPRRMSVHTFMCRPAISKSSFAEFMNDEGTFGIAASQAWLAAHREWLDFGRLGGADRERDLIFRLEYSPEELKSLSDAQRHWLKVYNDVTKYTFWRDRTLSESTEKLQTAREAVYVADQSRTSGAYTKAIANYEKGIELWRQIMLENAHFLEDMNYKEDCQKLEDRYLRLLAHVNKPTPARRPFDGIVPPLYDQFYGNLQDTAKEAQSESGEPTLAPSGDAPPSDPPPPSNGQSAPTNP